MDYAKYFEEIGYKYFKQYDKLIVQDFQRHAGINADGIIGPITLGKIKYYNKDNFCPEVWEEIKPYKEYNDVEIEALMKFKLVGLGAVFNRCAKDNDFDVLHSIAHAILESGSGTSYIARVLNNLYGWQCFDSSPVESGMKFKSKAECIQKWSIWFNKEYLTDGGRWFNGCNEHGINVKYASSPIAGINKAFIVRDLREKLNG
jgi:beta-N-acetylglucosaminidase